MRFLFFILLLCSVNSFAQYKSYIIGVKGDTLNKVDLKGKKQGRWVVKVPELRGEPGYEEEGIFKDGVKEGTWRRFSTSGDLTALENYHWGNKDGKNVYFNNMGNPVREESWKAVNPQNPYDTVDVYDLNDPTKVVGKRVVKLEGFALKHGTWKFYDPMTGAIERSEDWYLDKPAEKKEDDLKPIDVSGNGNADGATTATTEEKKKNVPKPQAVLDYEKKNAGKKKIKVRDGSTGY